MKVSRVMVGANKILTVSYGTFSCTLEGFDDSFATMKEIAEYFRDLAAQDRYFGAEPPTPDAEMLMQIAQRDTNKQVEAQVKDNTVMLRAEAPASPEVPIPAVQTEQYIEDEVPQSSPELISQPVAEVEDTETVAEKLSRIRAVVERNQSAQDAAESEEPDAVAEPEVQDNDIADFDEQQDTALSDEQLDTASEFNPVTESQQHHTLPEEFETVDLDTDGPDLSFEPTDDIASTDVENIEVQDSDYNETLDDQSSPRSMKSEIFAPLQNDASEYFDESYDEEDPDLSSAMGAVLPESGQPDHPARDRYFLSGGETEDSAAMDRLLKEADSQFSNPETSRRRSAISHLRAAVAATVAERKTTPGAADSKPMDEDAYRADLAEVVRPQRLSTDTEAKPTDKSSPPPLMLVSSQRVDDNDEAEETPEVSELRNEIRAQLGSSTVEEYDSDATESAEDDDDENIFASDASFANFVSATGATELVDLLEAAAAFTRFVEGVPQFKRPRIMALVANYAGKDTHSREEGLRAFGVLLREGRFEKVKRGYFQISSSTRFRPHSRAAGE